MADLSDSPVATGVGRAIVLSRTILEDYNKRLLRRQALQPTPPNSTQAVMNRLVSREIRNARFINIGLGAFSLGLAAIITIRILYDAKRASKLEGEPRPGRMSWLTNLHSAEVFPLILSIGTMVQQTILVVIQGTSLTTKFVYGCDKTAQVVFPTLFILGYLHLVFGAECCVRAFRSKSFGSRKPRTARICLAIVALLLVATWIPTNVVKSMPECLGDIARRTVRYKTIALSIISVLILAYMIMATIIGVRLVRTVNVEPNERISASRVFYYLLASIAIHVFLLPFLIQSITHSLKGTAPTRIVDIVIFSQGILVSLIHIFLRTNAIRTAIKPIDAAWQPRRRFRFFGPSDLEIVNISAPVNLLHPTDVAEYYKKLDEKPPAQASRFPQEQKANLYTSPGPIGDQRQWPLANKPRLKSPKSGQFPASTRVVSHKLKDSNYSLFPTNEDEAPRLPAAVYSPPAYAVDTPIEASRPRTPTRATKTISSILDAYSPRPASIREPLPILHPATYTPVLQPATYTAAADKPPPSEPLPPLAPPVPPYSERRRNSSVSSSATLEIGFRFSIVPATAAATSTGPSARRSALRPSKSPMSASIVSESPAVEHVRPLQITKSVAQKLRDSRQQLNASQPPAPTQPAATLFAAKESYFPKPPEKKLPPIPKSRASGIELKPVPPLKTNLVSPPSIGLAVSTSPSSSATKSPGPGFF